MSQPKAVSRYNKIVKEQSRIHRTKERLDAVENLKRICRRSGTKWLASTIIKLYNQTDEIRVHAENKCRKIMTAISNFSSQIQHWYDIIHVYLALLCLKESDRKYSNPSNTYRFARNCNIEELRNSQRKNSRRRCGYVTAE